MQIQFTLSFTASLQTGIEYKKKKKKEIIFTEIFKEGCTIFLRNISLLDSLMKRVEDRGGNSYFLTYFGSFHDKFFSFT